MKFVSKMAGVAPARTDVFTYLFETRRQYPGDRVLYREHETGATLTLDELQHKSRQFATVLCETFSIQPMDVVAILATDSILFPVAYLGILAAGATVQLVPVQKELAAVDVTARLAAAGTKLLITNANLRHMAEDAVSQLSNAIPIIDLFEKSELFADNVTEYHGFTIVDHAHADAHDGFLNRTSGSTGGAMKTVVTTHAHFIAVMDATLRTVPLDTDPDKDVWLSTLSLGFFINAKLNIGLNILLGIPVVLMSTPFGPHNIDVIERYQITFLFLPPPVAITIAGATNMPDVDVSSIKWLLSAGASIHEGVSEAVSQKLNNKHLDLEWGTSETLLIAIQTEGHSSPAGSSGRLVNGVEALVVNPFNGKEVDSDMDGEILVRNSAARFAGYKGNNDANQATFDSDGWFHSGDWGHIDADNNVFIKDRMKELIRVGSGYGVHISATDLESAIFQHPAVSEVIVTAVQSELAQLELPTAFVILNEEWKGRQAEALQSLQAWAAKRLVGLQTLTGGFVLVDKYPQVGFKINRRALKALAVSQSQTLYPPVSDPPRMVDSSMIASAARVAG